MSERPRLAFATIVAGLGLFGGARLLQASLDHDLQDLTAAWRLSPRERIERAFAEGLGAEALLAAYVTTGTPAPVTVDDHVARADGEVAFDPTWDEARVMRWAQGLGARAAPVLVRLSEFLEPGEPLIVSVHERVDAERDPDLRPSYLASSAIAQNLDLLAFPARIARLGPEALLAGLLSAQPSQRARVLDLGLLPPDAFAGAHVLLEHQGVRLLEFGEGAR